MQLIFEQVKTGGDRNFGYLIADRDAKSAVLIDPSYDPQKLVQRASDQGLNIHWILNTHGHHDHTNGNSEARELTGAQVAIYHDSSIPHDKGLHDNEELTLGSLTIRCIYTPGHSPDHMVFYIPEHHILITGDHLFVGKIGGTGLEETSKQQYQSLHRLFEMLPQESTVWPGHDYGCRPSSTLALEKASNPFIQCKSFQEFVELKANWSHFKQINGLC